MLPADAEIDYSYLDELEDSTSPSVAEELGALGINVTNTTEFRVPVNFSDADEDELESLDDEDFEETRQSGALAADDPVRMYLRDIGQVRLLDPNSETWLSSQMAALSCCAQPALMPRRTGNATTARRSARCTPS